MKRHYGDDNTIHDTGYLDVETDKHGLVVAVWFRCQPLPFKQTHVDRERAKEMETMEVPVLVAVDVIDKKI